MTGSLESLLVWSPVNIETIKFMDPHLKNLNSEIECVILHDNAENFK